MSKKTFKIFVNADTQTSSVVEFDEKIPYYDLLKDERKKNNVQFIISCDLFLKLFKGILDHNFEIIDLQLLEEDSLFQIKIDELVSRKQINKLIQEIEFFNEETDIDVENIRFKGEINQQKFQLILQNNGIIIMDRGIENFDLINPMDELRLFLFNNLGLQHGNK